MSFLCFRLLAVFSTVMVMHVSGKIPDAEIRVNGLIFLASYGTFGSRKKLYGQLFLPPANDLWLCREALGEVDYLNTSTPGNPPVTYNPTDVLLTKRGLCSFERKAYSAHRLGAAGVIIYNNLESRYGFNGTVGRVVYPRERFDYECDNGQVQISSPQFVLDPPRYNGSFHDQFLTADSSANLCNVDPVQCPSQRCLITEKVDQQSYTACCAWDIHTEMGDDITLAASTDDIQAVFINMRQSSTFTELSPGTSLVISERPYPRFNLSSVLLWLLGTFVTWLASWLSASDYRRAHYKLTHPVEEEIPRDLELAELPSDVPPTIETPSGDATPSREDERDQVVGESLDNEPVVSSEGNENQNDAPVAGNEPTTSEQVVADYPASHTTPTVPDPPESSLSHQPQEATEPHQQETRPQTPARRRQQRRQQSRSQVPVMEMTVWHAALFVVVASALLLLLFYFEFYTVVTVLYGLGCSGGLAHLIFRPVFVFIGDLSQCGVRIYQPALPKVPFCGLSEITFVDLASTICAYTVGASWLYVWFTSDDPSENHFYWITQNLMGACVSILFLSLLRLNSIKVATVLLLAVFIYDIFFVFITPYLFDGDSVMVTVATSGGQGDLSADECEKYPSQSECRKGQPLPMLLTFPKIGDYRGGASLLGLGDIVLPGLLMSFAARLDAAKRLVGRHTRLDVRTPPKFGGYLGWLTFAYAMGLLFATLAVVWMNRGQPALLYIVPACMGTMVLVGKGEIKELWKGPRVIVWANRLVHFCDRHTFYARPTDNATEAESVVDDDDDDDETPPQVERGGIQGSIRSLT